MRRLSIGELMTRVGEHVLLRRRPLAALVLATALVAVALGVRLIAGDLLGGVPYLTFFSVIAVSAFVGGWSIGVYAAVLGGACAIFVLIPAPVGTSDLIGLLGYFMTAALIVLLTHIATRTAEANVALARERQVLLMELQHRIKNHLQLLGAMIATHTRATTNERIRTRLEEAGRRLQVIAATYDNLYEPGALIDMGDHLQKICAFVEGGVAGNNSKIRLDAISTSWPVERVIPLSLITNELLTNSVKHAPPDKELEIDVALKRHGKRLRFSVHTRDTVLPSDFTVDGPGLGLRIASMLAQQLGGRLEAPQLPEAVFVVDFPEPA
jgi:two-component sensor histidine kinase